MRSLLAAILTVGLAFVPTASGSAQEGDAKPAAGEPVSFTNQIAPILLKNCMACHGERQPKGGYQLHTFEALMTPGDSTVNPVTGGDIEDSELYRLICETDKDSWMPREGDHLPEDQVALIKRWIEEGAKFDGPDPKATLASIAPRVYDPAPEAYRAPLPITALAFNPAGDELAVGGYNEITIWNPADGTLLRRIRDVAQRTYGLAYSADGKLLAAASGTPGSLGEVKLVDPATGETVKVLGTMGDVAFGVAFGPEDKRLAACAADRSIRVYDVATGKEEVLIEDHADWVMGVAWNHDGTRLASASRDKTSKVFDAKTGEAQTTYNGHGEAVFGVAFSPDGKQVLTAGADRKVHVWNPADGKKAAEIAGFGNEVYKVYCQGENVFTCSADKSARQHGLAKRNQIRVYSGHADWVFSMAYHDAAKRLATGSYDGEVRVWNTEDGKAVATFIAAPGYAGPETASN